MNYKKITSIFDITSKVCAVLIAPSIVFSTAATVFLFPMTVLFSVVAGNLREKFNLIIHNPVAIIFLFFYFMFLIGVFYSTAPWPDVFIVLRKYDKILFAVMFFPLFTEEKWRNYAINAFMAAILVLLLASYLRGFGLLPYGAANGVVEVFKKSIEFNFLMAFGAYLCLFKIRSRRICCVWTWIWIVFFAFTVHTVLFRSAGRTGYFVFAGLMTLFFLQRFSWKGLVMAVTSVVLLFSAAFLFSPTFQSRIDAIYSDIKVYNQNDYTSVGARITFVKNSLKLIRSNPIIGTGTGSFAEEYNKLKPAPTIATKNPHNEYLYIMVQFGVVGLIVLLMFFGVPLWYSRLLPERSRYIARGVVVGIMLGSLANSWLLDVTEGHFCAYFLALTCAALSSSYHRFKQSRV